MRFLLVDDNPDDLALAVRALRPFHLIWHVTTAASAEAARAELSRRHYDVVIADQNMPGGDGDTLLEYVRETYPTTHRMMLHGSAELVERLSAVCDRQLLKPLHPSSLREAIAQLCYAHAPEKVG